MFFRPSTRRSFLCFDLFFCNMHTLPPIFLNPLFYNLCLDGEGHGKPRGHQGFPRMPETETRLSRPLRFRSYKTPAEASPGLRCEPATASTGHRRNALGRNPYCSCARAKSAETAGTCCSRIVGSISISASLVSCNYQAVEVFCQCGVAQTSCFHGPPWSVSYGTPHSSPVPSKGPAIFCSGDRVQW